MLRLLEPFPNRAQRDKCPPGQIDVRMTWEELDALVDSLHFTVENRGVRVPPVGGLIGSDPAALELLGRLKTKLDESW